MPLDLGRADRSDVDGAGPLLGGRWQGWFGAHLGSIRGADGVVSRPQLPLVHSAGWCLEGRLQLGDAGVTGLELAGEPVERRVDLVLTVATDREGEPDPFDLGRSDRPFGQAQVRALGRDLAQPVTPSGSNGGDRGEHGEDQQDLQERHEEMLPCLPGPGTPREVCEGDAVQQPPRRDPRPTADRPDPNHPDPDQPGAAGARALGPLRLGRHTYPPERLLVMAVVNRTPDSFFDRGATYALGAALQRVDEVVAEGADVVDVGGVKAGPGLEVDDAEEIRRVVPLVEAIRERHPGVAISVDTWRADVGAAACRAGADLLNDPWGGADPRLVEVAARFGASVVCAHAGGLPPRTDPHRVQYDDVMADVLARTTALAQRALALGIPREAILLDPAHDFAKNTHQSLEVTRRLGELVDTGFPVLVALSNKAFIGETLDAEPGDRLAGSLASAAVCAWLGARVVRAHAVRETRQALDMVASIRGDRRPARALRALA